MKKLTIYLSILSFALTACSRQEDAPSAETAKLVEAAPAETTPTPAETAAAETSTRTSLVADATAMKKSVEREAPKATSDGDSLLSKALGGAGSLASQLDWQNMSWDKVSEIPYSDKTQLAVWASQQAETWKGKLMDAAKDKGVGMISNLGDSGWQGALKNVVDAIQGVKESSPETWELARGALVSSWDKFQTEAQKVIGG